jgi:hypothetical protein
MLVKNSEYESLRKEGQCHSVCSVQEFSSGESQKP